MSTVTTRKTLEEIIQAKLDKENQEYKALSKEAKAELFENSVKNLEHKCVPVRAEITSVDFMTDKNGNPIVNEKNRVIFKECEITLTWYPEDGKPQTFVKTYEGTSTGCMLSTIINMIALPEERYAYWKATDTPESVEMMIELFNEHKDEEQLALDIYCLPGTDTVKKSRLEFVF